MVLSWEGREAGFEIERKRDNERGRIQGVLEGADSERRCYEGEIEKNNGRRWISGTIGRGNGTVRWEKITFLSKGETFDR
jgi:hypothetical protein